MTQVSNENEKKVWKKPEVEIVAQVRNTRAGAFPAGFEGMGMFYSS